MSEETVQEHIDEALELVVVGDVDTDAAMAMFEDAQSRLKELQAVRESGA